MICVYQAGDTTIRNNGTTVENCQDFILMSATDMDSINLLLNGGFSVEGFGLGFGSIIGLWVTGLTTGIIISMIRKLNKS